MWVGKATGNAQAGLASRVESPFPTHDVSFLSPFPFCVMIFRSFLLRLLRILTATASLCLVLMGITLFLRLQPDTGWVCLGLSLFALILNLVFRSIINRREPELIKEVAIWVYPSGAVLSIAQGVLLGFVLQDLLTKPGNQLYTPMAAGFLVAVVLGVRAFDIPWLRTQVEVYFDNQQRDQEPPAKPRRTHEPDKVY